MRVWKPLSVPISLTIGGVRTPEFTTGLDTTYALFVESERNIEFQRLECLMGMTNWQRSKTCAGAPEVIDIEWRVMHDGQAVATGSSRNSWGGFYSDSVAREVGHFAAQKDQRYSVVLDIRRDGGELNATHPKLLVQTHPGEWKDAVVGHALSSELRIIGVAAFATAGALTLIVTPLIGHLHRRYTHRKQAPQ